MNMTTRILTASLILTLASAGCSSKPPRKHHEPDGGFSYDPPETWKIVAFEDLKYKISHGASGNGFAPNINVVTETFRGSLEAYVDGNLKHMTTTLEGMSILKREEFQTDDGLAAVRVITLSKKPSRTLRQTYHFFSSGSSKYIATCSTLAEGGEALDAIFAKSMKTFRIH